MTNVRDDSVEPDPGFAELYARLPDAVDLEPWLAFARAAAPPVLYLGIGAGRLAVPLHLAGVQLIGVDAHPGMLAHLATRLPGTELIQSRLEDLQLQRRFDLVIVPSNILYTVARLRGAAVHVAAGGRLAFELANPHWVRAGGGAGVRVPRFDGNEARLEIDYEVAGLTYTQVADISLVWPEEVDRWLSSAGMDLERMFGQGNGDLTSSSTYYVVARPLGSIRVNRR
ncbi:MAG: class I SAM-dependent methyltransferase [Candidatus Dormibacteraeota bacterium]|nr:class I SAM-dependent methyltransferase [Candidatus Dormibacteraeota bacterium]